MSILISPRGGEQYKELAIAFTESLGTTFILIFVLSSYLREHDDYQHQEQKVQDGKENH